MFLRQHLVLPTLALAAAATFLAPARTNPTALMCTSGTATGTWINPKAPDTGSVEGKLLEDGIETYVVRADLIAAPSGNWTTLQGAISGKLESLTSNTVYRIDGVYEGLRFSGTGAYHMVVTTAPGGVYVGDISGSFAHKPGKAYGTFNGTFDLCP